MDSAGGFQMLNDLMDGVKSELGSFSLDTKQWTVQKMFNHGQYLSSLGYDGTRVSDFTWLTDVPLNKYEDPLKAILMGIPLTIYVHERDDGMTFDVMRGGEIMEGLRYYMRNVDHSAEHQPYHRRILQATITIVTFRCTMSHQDVKKCMGYLNGAFSHG